MAHVFKTLGVMPVEPHTFFLRYAINSNDNANQFCLYNFFGRMKLNEVNLASFVVSLMPSGLFGGAMGWDLFPFPG